MPFLLYLIVTETDFFHEASFFTAMPKLTLPFFRQFTCWRSPSLARRWKCNRFNANSNSGAITSHPRSRTRHRIERSTVRDRRPTYCSVAIHDSSPYLHLNVPFHLRLGSRTTSGHFPFHLSFASERESLNAYLSSLFTIEICTFSSTLTTYLMLCCCYKFVP